MKDIPALVFRDTMKKGRSYRPRPFHSLSAKFSPLGGWFLADERTHFPNVFIRNFIHAVGLFGMFRTLVKNLLLRFPPSDEITIHPNVPAR
jgi:hypothetical protein